MTFLVPELIADLPIYIYIHGSILLINCVLQNCKMIIKFSDFSQFWLFDIGVSLFSLIYLLFDSFRMPNGNNGNIICYKANIVSNNYNK